MLKPSYLTHSKVYVKFPQVYVITALDFELAYYDLAIKHFSLYATSDSSQ